MKQDQELTSLKEFIEECHMTVPSFQFKLEGKTVFVATAKTVTV